MVNGMKEQFLLSKKKETYSFDELCFLEECMKNFSEKDEGFGQSQARLECMKNSVESKPQGMAVFFMPKNMFDMFALVQGDNSVCDFDLCDVENFVQAVEKYECSGEEKLSKIKSHVLEKVKVLLDFIRQGNGVKPVAIEVDAGSFLV